MKYEAIPKDRGDGGRLKHGRRLAVFLNGRGKGDVVMGGKRHRDEEDKDSGFSPCREWNAE